MRSGDERTRAGGASELGRDFEVYSECESMMQTENLSHILAISPLPSGWGIGHPSAPDDSSWPQLG